MSSSHTKKFIPRGVREKWRDDMKIGTYIDAKDTVEKVREYIHTYIHTYTNIHIMHAFVDIRISSY